MRKARERGRQEGGSLKTKKKKKLGRHAGRLFAFSPLFVEGNWESPFREDRKKFMWFVQPIYLS